MALLPRVKRHLRRAVTLATRRKRKYGVGYLEVWHIKGRKIMVKGNNNWTTTPEGVKVQTIQEERNLRKAIIDHFYSIHPAHYSIQLSKRYPPIQGKRTEQYYDLPTLHQVCTINKYPIAQQWARSNGMNQTKAAELAKNIIHQLETDFSTQKLKKKYGNVFFDFVPDNIFVEKVDSDGKMHLILFDI